MGLFDKIFHWLRDKVRPQGEPPPDMETENPETWEPFSEETSSEVMLAAYYDKDLFERARTQWQFGDWESLARIERESLYHHPQRASLALLAAAGHQQCGDMEATRKFTSLAQEWGASKKTVSQVLIAGVYNTLGKASALCGQQQRAIGHFEKSVRTAWDGGDTMLLTQARVEQCLDTAEVSKTIFGSSFTLKSQQQNKAQPENENNQYTKPHDEIVPLFSISGKDCEDSDPITLDFYPAGSQYFNREGNLLHFHLGRNKPGYIVTNPSGNLDLAPAEQQLDLQPDSTYRITGRIAIEAAASLIFWVFEYREAKTANKTSYPCPDGKVNAVFRTGRGVSKVAFGIRVVGEGVIDIASSELYLDSGSSAEQAYEAHQNAVEQKRRIEESKKNLMQLEDFVRLQHYMGSDFIMPDMHSWPISPDMGVLLIRQIEAEQYDAVIFIGIKGHATDFGS